MTATPTHILTAIREGIAAGKNARTVAEDIGLTRKKVLYISERNKLGPWKSATGPVRKHSVPADFAKMLESRGTQEATAAHYGVSRGTVSKWAGEMGLRKPPPPKKLKEKKPVPFRPHRALVGATSVAYREESDAGEAQRYLQTEGYIPVFRSDSLGKEPRPKGQFWRCGRRVLTDAEIVALAMEVRKRRERRLRHA